MSSASTSQRSSSTTPRKSTRNQKKRLSRPPPISIEDNGVPIFVVERIMATRRTRLGPSTDLRRQYLIRWEGYGPEDDTWELRCDVLAGSRDLIESYESQHHQTNITIISKRGLLRDPTYLIRFCGGEDSDDYSPMADTKWLTIRELKKLGLSLSDDQIEGAINNWETRQLLTPPRSPTPLREISEIRDHRHYISRQLVEILDMVVYKSKAYKKTFHTKFLVRHKLVQRYKKERGVQTRLEWYTANHLSNVFTRATLREKINDFSPAILAGPVVEDGPKPEISEYEQERQRKMKENADLMKELGLSL